MDRILDQAGSLIANLSIVELEHVFAIKMRTGEIDVQSLEIARRHFRADLAHRRLLVRTSYGENALTDYRRLRVPACLCFDGGCPEGNRG